MGYMTEQVDAHNELTHRLSESGNGSFEDKLLGNRRGRN